MDRMNSWTVTGIVEIGALCAMIFAVIGLFVERLVSKRGIGARVIQSLSVSLLIPMIFILALEKLLTSETTAALFGGLAGYLLSDIGKFEPKDLSSKPAVEIDRK